jgi:hypothetical protein
MGGDRFEIKNENNISYQIQSNGKENYLIFLNHILKSESNAKNEENEHDYSFLIVNSKKIERENAEV